jgi:YidC/Oxa1 family membrane protein insertase
MFEAFYNLLTESLLLLYQFLGNNYILAITVFTVIIRLITLPLNLRQQRSMIQTQELQPQIQAIQKKYRDNPQKMQEEFGKIGYNPADTLMGCLPTLIQFPILIGMYRAIQYTLGSTPLDLYELSLRTSTVDLSKLLPVDNKFLWLNLAQPDPWYILPILVGGGMYLQQKLFMPNTSGQTDKDNPAAAMSRSMLYTMPLMFGMFSLSFPSGLSIYFIVSNLIGIGQGFITKRHMDRLKAEAADRPKPQVVFEDDAEPTTKKVEAGKNQPSANGHTATRKQQAKKKGRAGKR